MAAAPAGSRPSDSGPGARGIRLGAVLGFEIRLDYSWFIIFFLILWSFTVVVFPAQAPGQPGAVYVAMGAAATILFFGSLIAHEVSHSLVARARGVPMEGITLFIFGGMARAGTESRSPGEEFAIAGIGPLTSVALALLFWSVGWLGIETGLSPAVVAVAEQLAILNLVLAVFNLLPGFPLDGGRLLRAAVWKATGSLTRATRVATGGGKMIGLVLVALGIFQIFALNLLGGVWLILIGGFLRLAAESSLTQVMLTSTLAGVSVSEVMTPDPVTAPGELSVEEFVRTFLLAGRHSGYPVVENGAPIGVISLAGVRPIPAEEWSTRTVASAAVPLTDRLTVAPEESMDSAVEKLQAAPNGRLLVMDHGRLVGILTRGDLARLVERARLLARGPARRS